MRLSILSDVACGYELACSAFVNGITPPPRLGIREWADSRRMLPSKGAAEPGQWRTNRVPFLAEIMDCLNPYHPSRRVVFMKSSQVGGTEIALNFMGWFVDTQRSSLMVVQPTLDMAEKFSKQRFAPMIEASPTLSQKIKPARSRDSGNTTLMKEWPGGLAVLAGANSAASLASMPIGNLLLDEIDRYEQDIDGEGDPIKIAEARTTTFRRAKILLISSPTIESLSRINKEFLASDQRHYHVPCPHCGEHQVLKFEQLRWPEKQPEEALYYCEHCGTGIEHSHKTWMLDNGYWLANNPESKVAGFHISGLYGPSGLALTWGEIAAEYDAVKYDPVRLKVFKNTRLGVVEKDPTEKLDWEELKARAEDVPLRTLPAGCLAVTIGVDVQKDRFAILALGHGRRGRKWVLDFVEIETDPNKPDEWQNLTDYLNEPFVSVDGFSVKALSVAIDSGNWQNEVLSYVRRKPVVGLFATKGASTYGKPIIGRPSKIDLTIRGKVMPGGAEQWQVGHDTAKFSIFSLLQSDKQAEYDDDRMVHFSKYLPDYFYVQLTAEVYDPHKRKWVKVHQRNEGLDTFVYALAASYHPRVRINLWPDSRWDAWEERLKPKQQTDLFGGTEEQAKPEPVAVTESQPKAKRRRWK